MRIDGHVGLSNEKVKEGASGDFSLALSYLKASEREAHFVIHVYSNSFDYSPLFQRSNVRGTDQRKNFLERLGFTYSESCNVLGRRCYYKVLEEGPGRSLQHGSLPYRRASLAHSRFDKLVQHLGEVFEGMRSVDRLLFDAGFDLPWDELKMSPIALAEEEKEKVYPAGHVYDFYSDLLDIAKTARNEVLLMDAYPNEDVLNLYLKKIPRRAKIRILTNKPKGNFIKVAGKFKSQAGIDFEVRRNKDCHDRVFFVDKSCWVMGQSIKDAGRKPTYLARMEGYDLLRKIFDDLWDAASPLI